MVQHAEFISKMAGAIGESENTVKLVYRALREAGIVDGKRGKNAPERTPLDAAVFLCWIGFTDKPSLAPAVLKDFGQLVQEKSVPAELADLGLASGHTLLEMLTAMVAAVARGRRFDSAFPYIQFSPEDMHVRVELGGGLDAWFGFERDRELGADDARYAKPYRTTRTFPQEAIERIGAIFHDDMRRTEAAE